MAGREAKQGEVLHTSAKPEVLSRFLVYSRLDNVMSRLLLLLFVAPAGAFPSFPPGHAHPGRPDFCAPTQPNTTTEVVPNAGGRVGELYWIKVARGERWPKGEPGSWDSNENAVTGKQCFAEYMTKAMTYMSRFFGEFLIKKACKSGTGGGQAVVVSHADGQLAIGAPRADMKTNGEETLCTAIALTNPDSRIAAHAKPVPVRRPGSPCDSIDEVEVTQMAVQAGAIEPGAQLCLPTRRQLQRPLDELTQDVVQFGFIVRRGGEGLLTLLLSTVHGALGGARGHVERVMRLLGDEPHSHEGTDPARWGGFILVGALGTVAMGPGAQEQLDALYKVQVRNGDTYRNEEGELLRPGDAGHVAGDGFTHKGDTYTNAKGVKLKPGDEGHVAGDGFTHKGQQSTALQSFAVATTTKSAIRKKWILDRYDNVAKGKTLKASPVTAQLEAIFSADPNYNKYSPLEKQINNKEWPRGRIKNWFTNRRIGVKRAERRDGMRDT